MIVDTGVMFAAMDRSDASHVPARHLLEAAAEILLPAPTLVELDWLSTSRRVPAVDTVLRDVATGAIGTVELTIDDYRRVAELRAAYSDLPLDFVDASVVAVCERLRESTVATLDRRHFSVVRPLHVGAFTLVP